MSTNESKEKRGLDGTLWDDPDHEGGLPWRKNTAFLYSLRQEYDNEQVDFLIAASESGQEILEVRRFYRLWLSACRGALTTIANEPQMPGDEGDMAGLAVRFKSVDEKAPRDLSRHEYLDLAAKGQVTDEERLIYLEHCYVVDDLSRDTRMRLSAEIQEIRDKIDQDLSRE